MKITLEMLQSKGACSGGMRWVKEFLPDGAEYQDFLDALAAADKPDWASWLLSSFGPTVEVKTVTEVAGDTRHIFATGRLVFKCSVFVLGEIEAGRGIIAGEGIKAGWGIKAGEGIEAGWGIEAGCSITCSLDITATLRIFAGTCTWRLPTKEELCITCRSVKSGTVAAGILIHKEGTK